MIRCVRGLGYQGVPGVQRGPQPKEGQVRGTPWTTWGACPAALGADGGPPLKAVRTHRAQLEETLEIGAHRGTGAGRPDPGRGAIH